MTGIELRNENGVIVGYDPDTGEKVPISLESFEADDMRTGGEPVHSITYYGAVGDGATDNTTAIEDAIAAADRDGGTVFIPAGDFYYASTIDVSNVSDIDIVGTGTASILRHDTDDDDGITGSNLSGVSFTNFRHVGNASAGRKQQGFQLSQSEDCEFRELIVESWAGDAIVAFNGCDNIRFVDNDIYNTGDDGVNPGGTGGDTTNCTVRGNYIEGCASAGIHISAGTVNATVTDNHVVECFIDFYESRGCVVDNNVVENSPDDGIKTSSGDASNCYGNTISNNTIINPASYGVAIRHGEDFSVDGNTILGGDRAVEINTSQVDVRNNTVISAGTRSELSGSADHAIVYSNSGLEQRATCSNNTVIGAWSGSGIFVDDTHLSVVGNVCEDAPIRGDEGNGDYNSYYSNIATSVVVGGTNSESSGNIED